MPRGRGPHGLRCALLRSARPGSLDDGRPNAGPDHLRANQPRTIVVAHHERALRGTPRSDTAAGRDAALRCSGRQPSGHAKAASDASDYRHWVSGSASGDSAAQPAARRFAEPVSRHLALGAAHRNHDRCRDPGADLGADLQANPGADTQANPQANPGADLGADP